METHLQAAERPAIARSIEDDLGSYLDAIADATAIFRSAVDAYLQNSPEGACWQQARRITEHLRMLDDMQQRLETEIPVRSTYGGLVSDMVDPLAGVSRLLKDMKRQITGFAIESGFVGTGRRVPEHLVADVQDLTEEVCAAVDALVESYRPCTLWWEQVSLEEEQENEVKRHESQADRLSMRLIREILGDDSLDIEVKLPLAQFVEEIDRVADEAERIDRELRNSRAGFSNGRQGLGAH